MNTWFNRSNLLSSTDKGGRLTAARQVLLHRYLAPLMNMRVNYIGQRAPRWLELTWSTSKATSVSSSPAAVADWGEEAAGGDAGDLGETAVLGDDARGEAIDLGDVADLGEAARGGVAVGFGDVAACAVESAIVGPVLDMSVPRDGVERVQEMKERDGTPRPFIIPLVGSAVREPPRTGSHFPRLIQRGRHVHSEPSGRPFVYPAAADVPTPLPRAGT